MYSHTEITVIVVGICTLLKTVLGWNETCPLQCECDLTVSTVTGEYMRTTHCYGLKIIPVNISSQTQILNLRDNHIDLVNREISKLLQLVELDLSSNELSSIGLRPAFENLTSLRVLNLTGNSISQLHYGTFSGLRNLTELHLDNNRLSTIELNTFSGLSRLKYLSLSSNRITRVYSEWFDDLSRLQILDLSDNKIKNINDGTFSKLSHLLSLNLSGNVLKQINNGFIKGLDSLNILDISDNKLSDIPSTSLVTLSNLTKLSIGGNMFKYMNRFSFHDHASLREINVSGMRELVLVDIWAFYNMPELTTVYMHDNSKLTYIDPKCFEDVPKLEKLFVHNNNLMALSADIRTYNPNLLVITLHQNPLHCDCNIYWIKEILERSHKISQFNLALMSGNENKARYSVDNNTLSRDEDVTIESMFYKYANKYVCDTPLELNAQLLVNIPLQSIPRYCAPTVIPFFAASHQCELGDDITFICSAIGVPTPHKHWLLADGKVVNNTSNYSRIRLSVSNTLYIQHLKSGDAGTYTCVATNSYGYDTTSTVLKLHSKNVHLIRNGVATNFVTLTWNGTQSTMLSSNYVIMYKEKASTDKYHQAPLFNYMRQYTINNLKPHTVYEFCIGYIHGGKYIKLNCTNIQTKHQMFEMAGIKTINRFTVLLVIICVFSFFVLFCVMTAFIRKYRKRREYKDPTTETNGSKQLGEMSQIPLYNLYHPQSTPLYTSTTSLISTGASSNA